MHAKADDKINAKLQFRHFWGWGAASVSAQ